MRSPEVIETTVAEVTGELIRQGADPGERIVIELHESLAVARPKSRARIVAADLTDGDAGRGNKQERRESETNLTEAIRRRFAPLGVADDLELPPREMTGFDPPSST